MSDHLLGRRQIGAALTALDAELVRRQVTGEVFVVGGAAMCLAYNRTRTTRDVDAVFEPKMTVYEAAVAVAEDLGLPDDWLNDAVKGFIPGSDPDRRSVFEGAALRVDVASPRFLLAMKLLASRVDADVEDIRTLYRLCGFSTAREGLDLLEQTYPRAAISARVSFLLQELFGPLDEAAPG